MYKTNSEKHKKKENRGTAYKQRRKDEVRGEMDVIERGHTREQKSYR
jgi:hypothetical protein